MQPKCCALLIKTQSPQHVSQPCFSLEFCCKCIVKCHLPSIVHEFISTPFFTPHSLENFKERNIIYN